MVSTVSIELVSSSTRVTSAKSAQRLSLKDRHPDPKIGPQVYLGPIKAETCSTEVSIAPCALSPSTPPSKSIDSKIESSQQSPSCTTGLMIRFWESSLPLNTTDEEMKEGGRGGNKRVKSGRPQRFALHPHFPNQPTPQHTFPTFFCM